MELKKKVIKELEKIIDPETNMDVLSMGLIKNIDVSDDGRVSLEFIPSSPIYPLVFSLAFNIQKAVKGISEIKSINVDVKGHDMAEGANILLKEYENNNADLRIYMEKV